MVPRNSPPEDKYIRYIIGLSVDELRLPILKSSVFGAQAGAPDGLVGDPRVYADQFCGFESHGVHTRRYFFFAYEMSGGKRESVSY